MRQLFGDVKRVYDVGELVTYPIKAAFLQQTIDYRDRVEASGGVVIDMKSVDNAYKMLNSLGIPASCAISADWGVLKNATDDVETLFSLTGSLYDLTQASLAFRPLWLANQQNGKPVIECLGTKYILRAFTLVQPEHIFCVYRSDSWVNSGTIYDGGTSATMILNQNTTSPDIAGYSGASITTPTNVTGAPIGQFGQSTVRFLQNNNIMRLNGANTGTPVAGGAANGDGISIGARPNGTNVGNISMAEIWIFPSNVAGFLTVESYLKDKWGTP